jgi:hypothetical protein
VFSSGFSVVFLIFLLAGRNILLANTIVMKKIVWMMIYVLIVNNLCGQPSRQPVAAGYPGISAYSDQADVFSFTANQASLAALKASSAGVYGERRFLLRQLDNYYAVLALVSSSGNFALKGSYFGSKIYNETAFAIAYGRRLGLGIDAGIQFNYHRVYIPGYVSASALVVEAGGLLHLSDRLITGIQICNPAGGNLTAQEKIPSRYTLGMGYQASQEFFITTELVKEEDQPFNVNVGFQYNLPASALVRAGISSATSVVWAGVGFIFHSFRIDITTAYHQRLGLTPGLMLVAKR